VDPLGFEPRTSACKTEVMPFHHGPVSLPSVGPRPRIRTPHVTRLSTVCVGRSWATDALVPPGGFDYSTRAKRAVEERRSRSGRLTTTSRVKSPACCVHTTKGMEQRWSEWPDSNRHRNAWKACRHPLPHIRFGSAYGYRTRPSTLAPWNAASTPRPNSGRRCRRPADILQLSKSPFISNRLVGSQGIEPRVPVGEIGVTGRQRDHPLVLPV
jgi:hypothetical protein